MMPRTYPLLTNQEQQNLYDALLYMKMAELKKSCQMLSLPDGGKKIDLIDRIMTFIKTGKIQKSPIIPDISYAKNYPPQVLHNSSLMLYGDYKNDANTRAFFKKIIGAHFHFTAFGIDWLNDRWLKGAPPTYQEFADYWVKETAQRAIRKPEPKGEWAYINFLQRIDKESPDMQKADILYAWKQLRAEKAQHAQNMIHKIVTIVKN